MNYRNLWIGLAVVILASFGVLGYYGYEIYQQAPPVPNRVVTTDGREVFDRSSIQDGQGVWMSTGGQELGSVWGHGAYVAPDWTADFLHREATWILDRWATEQGAPDFASLDEPTRASLQARLRQDMRTNTYEPDTGTLTISPVRADAIAAVSAHYTALFGADPGYAELRDAYAMKTNTVSDPERMRALNSFFWWTAWAAKYQASAPMPANSSTKERTDQMMSALVGALPTRSSGGQLLV